MNDKKLVTMQNVAPALNEKHISCLPAHMQIDKHQIKTTSKVSGERSLCFVGTRESTACMVVIMKQRLPFQQLPFAAVL